MNKPDPHAAVTSRLLDVMNTVISSDLEPEINNQAAFAEAIGVHPATISQFIGGTKQVTVEQLIALCNRFKVSGTYILSGKGDIFLPGHKIQNMTSRIENKLNLITEELDLLKAAVINSQTKVTETRNKGYKTRLKRAN